MNRHVIKFIRRVIHGKSLWQALLIGVITGFLIVAFNSSISWTFNHIQNFTLHNPQRIWILPLITTLGGLISGLLVFKFAPETRGSGIPYVKLCLANYGKLTRIRSIFVKFFAGLAAIGSGLSLGREGPSVQLGAGAGALVGKLFNATGFNKDKLIAAGAGSAIAATFNAPIAGTVFVLEELIHKFSYMILLPTMVAAVVASAIARECLGNNPAFNIIMTSADLNFKTIAVCLILGVLAGVLGVMFARTILITNKIYTLLNKIPNWAKPALAGLIIGLIGVILPQVMGSGNLTVESLLQGNIGLKLVLVIFIVKFFVTPICFGSGAAGGIFLPTLMLGAFLGYLTGGLSHFIGLTVNPIAFGAIGMAAFLSAVARTPITAVIMVFEMTGGYATILPIMLTAAIADVVAEKMAHRPIYSTLAIQQLKNEKKV